MNITAFFLAHSLNMELVSILRPIAQFDEGLSDVLTCTVPLMPVIVTSSFDSTIPYMHVISDARFLSKAIPGTEKLDIFLPVRLIDNSPCAAANHGCVLVCW